MFRYHTLFLFMFVSGVRVCCEVSVTRLSIRVQTRPGRIWVPNLQLAGTFLWMRLPVFWLGGVCARKASVPCAGLGGWNYLVLLTCFGSCAAVNSTVYCLSNEVKPRAEAHTFNVSTLEAEVRASLRIPGHSGLHSEKNRVNIRAALTLSGREIKKWDELGLTKLSKINV